MKYRLWLLAAAILCASCGEAPAGKEKAPVNTNATRNSFAAKPFRGGSYEASGVVQVAGTDGFLFVDDNHPKEVFWLRLNSSGEQVGAIRALPLGVHVEDPEDITSDGEFYYIIGSQSDKKSGAKAGLIRFKFDSATLQISSVNAIAGLREYLLDQVPGLPPEARDNGQKDGMNIEGLAWDPKESCLLLGFRSPRIGKDAMVVRLKMRDRTGPFTLENLTVVGSPVPMSFDGVGIRGLGYDGQTGSLLVIAGPTEKQNHKPFVLWEWKDNVARKLRVLDSSLKPEGICRNGDQLLIVCDGSAFALIPAP